MDIYQWENVFQSKALDKAFTKFMVRRHIRKLWYVGFYHFYLSLLLVLRIQKKERYFQNYWRFLDKVHITPDELDRFKNRFKVKNLILLSDNRPKTIVGQSPNFLMSLFIPREVIDSGRVKIDGLAVDQEGNWTPTSATSKQDLTEKTYFGDLSFIFKNGKFKNKYVVFNNGIAFKTITNMLLYWFVQMMLVVGISIFIGMASVIVGGYKYSFPMVKDVLMDGHLLMLNCLAPVLVGLALYFLLGRIWLGTGLNALIFVGLGIANHYKLMFRDDAVQFADLQLVSEASKMSQKYAIQLTWKHVVLILLFITVLIMLRNYFKPVMKFQFRIVGLVLVLLLTFTWGKSELFNPDTYGKAAYVKYGNIWKATSQYMTRGFPYAFAHSIESTGVSKPEGYNKAEAKALLDQYKSQNIPDKKKVNVIMIMMEAYNDFSKYPQLEIDPSVYAGLKNVEKESISGHLVTNIFAGGTIDTERKTVTGYSKLQNFNHNTDSFAWYFKNQGYQTQALHPMYGWFYNRRNVDPVLGISDFKYMENYYNKYNQFIVPDKTFFKSIHSFSEKSKKPYFNLSVTYQNHGPYANKYTGTPLLKWQDGYNQADYAIINNYLAGIKKTSEAIEELTNSFKNDKPTVIMFYGDHNPWLGEQNSVYKMLNIDLNLGTAQGYQNYYQTPYVMWANKGAKKVLKNDFVGQGKDFSPMYLLPEFFKQAGLKGDSYMQYLQNTENKISVIGENKYKVGNKYVKSLTGKDKKTYDNLKKVEYYRLHEKVSD
ncbi:hypothetical protein C0213_08715 [Latilactobacillus sakei]|nr:LTA synthase family protein [Latilactobacillus sakei]AUX12498.1 hypothetical protein C0213_08715 [Latilactobacillus sakei]